MACVLVVDDSPVNLLLSVTWLEQAGHVALTAESSQEALRLARQHRPDVILMDLRLPDLDGVATTRELKADPALAHIPVVGLSACAMPDEERAMRGAGCDDYITKPVRFPLLLEVLDAVLARHRGAPAC